MKHTTIAIIGAGAVGVTTAYALLLKNLGAEIWLADIDEAHTQGELFDLQDALSFSSTHTIRQVSIKQAAQASIIIITAGAAQLPGQTRLDLLKANHEVMQAIAQQLQALSPDAIVIAITNPVDIVTSMLQALLNHPKEQIIGSGTFLDSQRFRGFIAETLDVSVSSIHAYILGEHGDTQFPAWHSAQAAGRLLLDFAEMTPQTCDRIAEQTKRKAYEIINRKGATYYGIAACVSSICQVIMADKHHVLPISSYHKALDVCLSLPVVLGEDGVVRAMPINLSDAEQVALEVSADKLKQSLRSIGI